MLIAPNQRHEQWVQSSTHGRGLAALNYASERSDSACKSKAEFSADAPVF